MTTFLRETIMKSVGIREFRDKASQYLASSEVVAVKRHGKLVGFYIPVEQSDEIQIEQALQRLSQTIEIAMAESGMDEAALSRALDLSQKEQ
jgi:antitoxin (DNA-binding transcriptional repressor) of toxin-antitoxin stability system